MKYVDEIVIAAQRNTRGDPRGKFTTIPSRPMAGRATCEKDLFARGQRCSGRRRRSLRSLRSCLNSNPNGRKQREPGDCPGHFDPH
jgi:hypothetical protein